MALADVFIFTTQRYKYLGDKLLQSTGFKEGFFSSSTFPDGEYYHKLLTDVEGKKAVLVGGTIDDKETLELFDKACGLIQYGVDSLTIVIPFFGYSTMERAANAGDVVMAKNRALLLSAIPSGGLTNRIAMLDLHTEGLPYYFTTNWRPVHLYCKSVIIQAATQLYGRDFILASTDSGRAKWVESLANDMEVKAAFVYKKRLSGENTQITGINADVEGCKVIIYDDMIRTGGSLIKAAKSYKAAGAEEISVIATHGIFTPGSFENLKNSGLFANIICTDTHPNVFKIHDENFHIHSVAPVISDWLMRISW